MSIQLCIERFSTAIYMNHMDMIYIIKGDHTNMREFTVIIEQDEDGIYIASVPELPGCHTQAETLDELNKRIKEAIELYLEVEADKGEEKHLDFIGIQQVKVEV
jgi:predicted RNase H-like HicB family nuclease